MGFFGLLNAALGNVSDGIKSLMADARKHMDKGVLDGIMAGLALVVMADKDCSEEEIAQASEQIKMHPILKDYPEGDTTLKLMANIESLKKSPTMAKLTLKGQIEKLKSKPEQAKVCIAMMIDVGAADGNFDDNEKAVVREVCGVLGISAREFGL